MAQKSDTASNWVVAALVIGGLIYYFGLRDKAEIVGSWKNSSGQLVQFRSDGTLHGPGLFGQGAEGKYELLDGNQIRLRTPGLLWGENEIVLHYSVSLRRLILSYNGTTETLTKQ